MKKLLAVLLVIVLTGSLTFVSISQQQQSALADEQELIESSGDPVVVAEEVIQVAAVEEPVPTVPEEPIAPEVPQNTATTELAIAEEVVSEEVLPYWQTDAIYQDLINEYAAAVAAGQITNAKLTLSDTAAAGLAGTIQVSGREVISNGTNAPAYDNKAALHLTPQEGYPDAGMSSDRSILTYKESTDTADIYEATFFFGAERYPDAPFTAFRTYVALEREAAVPEPEEVTPAPESTGSSVNNPTDEPKSDSVNSKTDSVGRDEDGQDDNQDIAMPRHLGMLSNPLSPLAAPNVYVGYTFTTNIEWIGEYNGNPAAAWFTVGTTWEGRSLSYRIACLNPHLLGPNNDYTAYYGRVMHHTVTAIDEANGLIYFDSYVNAPNSNYQNLGVTGVPLLWTFVGDISLTKQSSNPTLTDNHPLYDLAGTQYGLYKTWADANVDWARLHTFTVDSNGVANTATGLTRSTYYIKEIKAGKGYELDPVIYPVTLSSASSHFYAKDTPNGDPSILKIEKLDTRTGEAYGKDDPNGYLLADGEFTVRYWDNYYKTIEDAEASGAPTRTWIVKTSAKGRAALTPDTLMPGSDKLYYHENGAALIPLGSIAIHESTAPPGYLLPSPNLVNFQQITETGDPLKPVSRVNKVIVKEVPHEVIAKKVDNSTNAPVPDTEFTLYKESSPGAKDWSKVTTLITDAFGKCVFSPVAVGSYKLDETRPNADYADLEESGDSAHYFTIEPTSTEEVQVFKNDLIQVAIDVYKKTIPLTNTALDGTSSQAGNHVGQEEYIYRFGAKNLSNVRVDEFCITDSLEYVTSKGYRMTSLWTGTAPEGMDYDGKMHVLYRTNHTDLSESVSFNYNPMQANPYNPNNPQQHMSLSIEPGWRVWQECVSTTTAIRLDVADLKLAPGEYIVGIKAVYGGVIKGFYTGTGWEGGNNPQSYLGDRDSISTLSDNLTTYTEFELRDWAYSVVATDALLPFDEMGDETVMKGSIRADLSRNWGGDAPVLTDIAKDKVETRVIKPFSYPKENLGITPGNLPGLFNPMPHTGDSVQLIGIALLCATGGAVLTALAVQKRRRAKSLDRKEEGQLHD